ncbi:hypothetical protein KY343_02940 [Candidatus Woesearchaeota archaeon]|nr:hypothetical protein [Candidatus Woesearchaeota archaeon]
MEGEQTYIEYEGDIGIIHLGDYDLTEKIMGCAEEVISRGSKAIILDFEYVRTNVSTILGHISAIRGKCYDENNIEIYLCNVKGEDEYPHKALRLAGITVLEGIHVKGGIEETVEELSQGK